MISSALVDVVVVVADVANHVTLHAAIWTKPYARGNRNQLTARVGAHSDTPAGVNVELFPEPTHPRKFELAKHAPGDSTHEDLRGPWTHCI